MTTRPPETRRPAVGAAGQEMQSGTRLFLVIENRDLRQRWRPMAPRKQIAVGPTLAAYLRAMAREGGAR
jgi:hypothetical protein